MQIEHTVREIIAQVGDVLPEQVTMDLELVKLGVDSLMALSIISKVEKRFKVQIPENQLRGIRTLRQIVELLEKNKAKAIV